jgi:hypothetical protein
MTQRTVIEEEEINRMGKSWKVVNKLLRNRVGWQNFAEALCSISELQDITTTSTIITTTTSATINVYNLVISCTQKCC